MKKKQNEYLVVMYVWFRGRYVEFIGGRQSRRVVEVWYRSEFIITVVLLVLADGKDVMVVVERTASKGVWASEYVFQKIKRVYV